MTPAPGIILQPGPGMAMLVVHEEGGRGSSRVLTHHFSEFIGCFCEQSTGTVFGADHLFGNNFLGGFNFRHTESDLAFDKLNDAGKSQTWEAGLYSAWMPETLKLDFMAAYARNNYNSERHITFGTIDHIAEGSFDGNGYSVYLESSYLFNLQKIVVLPMISFQLVHMYYAGDTETGADALNLLVKNRDETSIEMRATPLTIEGVRSIYAIRPARDSVQCLIKTNELISITVKKKRRL